jgi:hypothetical protein
MMCAPRFALPVASGQRLQGFVPLCKAVRGVILDIAQGQECGASGRFSGAIFMPFLPFKSYKNQ